MAKISTKTPVVLARSAKIALRIEASTERLATLKTKLREARKAGKEVRVGKLTARIEAGTERLKASKMRLKAAVKKEAGAPVKAKRVAKPTAEVIDLKSVRAERRAARKAAKAQAAKTAARAERKAAKQA